MTPDTLRTEALDFLSARLALAATALERALIQDRLFSEPAWAELRQAFLSRFESLGEDKAQWLLMASLNDAFLAEKNYLPCPLW